jgi:hypothetical protein
MEVHQTNKAATGRERSLRFPIVAAPITIQSVSVRRE